MKHGRTEWHRSPVKPTQIGANWKTSRDTTSPEKRLHQLKKKNENSNKEMEVPWNTMVVEQNPVKPSTETKRYRTLVSQWEDKRKKKDRGSEEKGRIKEGFSRSKPALSNTTTKLHHLQVFARWFNCDNELKLRFKDERVRIWSFFIEFLGAPLVLKWRR